MIPSTNLYGSFCRPNLDTQLKSLALDMPYHKGDGNYLYYEKGGEEIRVLDFLGGFGALMFGHNNEHLAATLVAGLQQKIPFASQGSNRLEAGRLSWELNSLLRNKLGEDYLTILSNSGTEAIEICIKHSLHNHYNKKRKALKQINNSLNKIRTGELKSLVPDAALIEFLDAICPGQEYDKDIVSIISKIKKVNDNVLSQLPVLIALEKAFHGKTLGSIQLTYNSEYKCGLPAGGARTIHVRSDDVADLEMLVGDNCDFLYSLSIENATVKLTRQSMSRVACFFVEPIQGEGGMRVINKNFLARAARICKLNEIPLAFDEIQTGMGRTGTFLYTEQTGVVPDYIILSKSLGGGLVKIGATLIPRRVFGESFDKIHSSTFAEDGLSSVVASECLRLVEDDKTFLPNISQRSNQLKKGIENISALYPGIIQEIRGEGLMLGLEFKSQASSGSNCLRLLNDQDMLGYVISGYLLHEFGIRTLPCLSDKRVIRIEPSGYTTEEECNYFLTAIQRLCEILFHENMYEFCKFIVGGAKTDPNTRIKSYRNPPFVKEMDCTNRVAFIGHFIQAADMADWEKSFEGFTEAELEKILEAIYPLISPFVSDRKVIRSTKGGTVQFDLLGFVITSKIIGKHMRQKNLQPLLEKIDDCLELAESNGCSMVGFGGFTSIITGNCKNITKESVHYTTGNSFTTAMGLEAIFSEAPKMQVSPAESTFAAVGAGGNIASVYCEFMAQQVKNIVLIGAKGRLENISALAIKIFTSAILDNLKPDHSQLTGIARAFMNCPVIKELKMANGLPSNFEQLYDQLRNELKEDFPILVTDDIGHLRNAQLILSATNSPEAVIYPEMLGTHQTIICDIAVPFDVDASVYQMPNVKIIKGGIVRVPYSDDFKIPGIILPKGTAFACMSETMVLGLEGIKNNYSYGDISLDQVKHIYQVAKAHGFKLEQPKLERSY